MSAEEAYKVLGLGPNASEEEIRQELKKIIETTGASGPSDLGKVMGAASKAFAGRADNKTVSALVKEMLS